MTEKHLYELNPVFLTAVTLERIHEELKRLTTELEGLRKDLKKNLPKWC